MLKKIAVLSLAVIITLLAAACEATQSDYTYDNNRLGAGGEYWNIQIHEFPYDEFVSIFNDVMMFPAYIPEGLRSREDVTVSGWAHVDTKSGERFTGLNYTRKEDVKYYTTCRIAYETEAARIIDSSDKKYVITRLTLGLTFVDRSKNPTDYPNVMEIGELIFYWDTETAEQSNIYDIFGVFDIDERKYDMWITLTYDEESFTDSDFEEMKEYGLSELIKVIESFEYIN